MGLEIRKKRNGEIIRHWYGAFTDANHKRRIVALSEPIPAKGRPESLRDTGSPAFESSRARAEKELEVYTTEAAQDGRSDHLTERLIESKIGSKVVYHEIINLPQLWRDADRDGNKPSENHLRWCDSVFTRFGESVKCKYLYEVKAPDTKNYLDGIRQKLAADTARRMAALLRSAFSMFLPVGTENPFKKKVQNRKKQNKGDQVPRRALIPDEINQLFETAQKTDRLLYELAVTATLTGLRIGDVCNLKWESIDWKDGGWIELYTSKTTSDAIIPIWPRLRDVLESRLPEREQDQPYVFPEAAKMYNGISEKGWDHRKQIYYRGKKLFALAFCNTAPKDRVSANRIELSDILPEALEAVKVARMAESKRERVIEVIELYASGKTYTEISDITRLSKGQISDYLREVEILTGWVFRIGANKRQDLKTLMNGTRKNREVGKNAVSTLGWHNLKTTFITLALANNLPIETIKTITGNSDIETIRKHYFKPRRQHLKAVLGDKLPDVLTGNGNKILSAPETESEREQLQKMLCK